MVSIKIIFKLCLILLLGRYHVVYSATYLIGGAEDTAFNVGNCQVPFVQLPVNIPLTARYARYEPLIFNNHRDIFPAFVYTNRLTLIVELQHANQLTLSGGGLPNIFPNFYTFNRIQFHWPAEHTIEGVSYVLEAQLVYINSAFATFNAAVGQTNGFVVLSVLFHLSEHNNDVLSNILNSARSTFSTETTGSPTPNENLFSGIRLADILPEHYCSFFRYIGSRTVPNCNLNVPWTIFLGTRHVSQEQIKKFQTLPSTESRGMTLTINSRPINDLGNRIVSFQGALECKTGRLRNFNTIPWLLRPFLFFNRF